MKYSPTRYQNVFLTSCGSFLPGEAVGNEAIDDYVAPLNHQSPRIKKRILKDNGITTRYYGINPDGSNRYSAAQMASYAVLTSLKLAGKNISDITFLASGTSGGDVLLPGFGNMLQGELQAPPMELRSYNGICAAGVAALKDGANSIETGNHRHALVSAVEFPSRLFKKSRFEPAGYNVDFDAHFLRWMLSDGAGACVLSALPNSDQAYSLKLNWIHMKSFSGDYPVCMQLGGKKNGQQKSFMDYATFADAEKDGVLNLRQDTRLLPQLFEVGIHEYTELVKAGYIDPAEVDYFLCHYSSEKLGELTHQLMNEAGLAIDKEKWFSNLASCGNTGSASIFIMLAEFMQTKTLKPGDRVFCFVPESGRITVSYLMFTVVNGSTAASHENLTRQTFNEQVLPPHNPSSVSEGSLRDTLQQLAAIWHDYRSCVWRTPLVRRIREGKFSQQDYTCWMESWIPQVKEGSIWMRNAIAKLPPGLAELNELIETHAGEEQSDFMILFDDYRSAGGEIEDLEQLKRNPGGEALNAYMHSVSSSELPIGMLGGIYIIEGTGQRIIPVLLPMLRQQLGLSDRCFRFLKYHSSNDINHLTRWLSAVKIALKAEDSSSHGEYAESIVRTAREVANLYLLQWEHVL